MSFGGFSFGNHSPAPQRGRGGGPRPQPRGEALLEEEATNPTTSAPVYFGARPTNPPAFNLGPPATTAPQVPAANINGQPGAHQATANAGGTPNQTTNPAAPPIPASNPAAASPKHSASSTVAGTPKSSVPPEKRAMLKIWMENKSRFPLSSSSHGTELVTVVVGEGDDQRSYVVHKLLICTASEYFSAALVGSFKEAYKNNLILKDQCAMAFEVLYQFIYTGLIQPAFFYTKVKIPSDTLWLRTFKLADATMVHDLKQIAYKCLRDYFNGAIGVAPSQTFVDELFTYDYPQMGLQNFVVAHSAFWVNNEATTDWKIWHKRMEKNMAYGAAVGLKLVQVVSKTYEGSKVHPCDDKVFDPDVLFPEPAMGRSATSGHETVKKDETVSAETTAKAD